MTSEESGEEKTMVTGELLLLLGCRLLPGGDFLLGKGVRLLGEIRAISELEEYLEEDKEGSEEEGLGKVVEKGRRATFDELVG